MSRGSGNEGRTVQNTRLVGPTLGEKTVPMNEGVRDVRVVQTGHVDPSSPSSIYPYTEGVGSRQGRKGVM